MMRKGIVLIGVIISIISMCVVCNAETMVRYDVAGFDISVEIPEDWYYVDRATEEDDPVIAGIRMPLEEIRENFEKNDYAFFATSRPMGKTASIIGVAFSLWDNDDVDYNGFSDTEIQELSKDYAEYLATDGSTVVNVEGVGDKLKFIKAVIMREEDYYELSYLSSYNGITYSFLCYYNGSDLLDKAESLCDAIVCSLQVAGFDAGEKKAVEQESGGQVVTVENNIARLGDLKEYYIDRVPMYISVPSDYLIVDAEERSKLVGNMDYMFYSISPDNKTQVHCEMINSDSDIANLSAMSEADLKLYGDMMKEMVVQQYGEKSSSSIVDINGVKYIEMYLYMDFGGRKFAELSYTTVLNNKSFAISFDPELNADGSITDEAKALIEKIKASIQYDDTWICPSCGRENDLLFCPSCGTKKP